MIMNESMVFSANGRVLHVARALGDVSSSCKELREGFASLIQTGLLFFSDEISVAVLSLFKGGCGEICFVGERANAFHDDLDFFLEEMGGVKVITTAFESEEDAIEYVLFGAGAAQVDVLVITGGSVSLERKIVDEFCATAHGRVP